MDLLDSKKGTQLFRGLHKRHWLPKSLHDLIRGYIMRSTPPVCHERRTSGSSSITKRRVYKAHNRIVNSFPDPPHLSGVATLPLDVLSEAIPERISSAPR